MTADELPRQRLLDALEADLIGPFASSDPMASEVLEVPPSRWYLAGFLAPQEGRDELDDPEADDELAAGPDEDEEESAGQEPEPKQKSLLPASIGLSVLIPPPEHDEVLTATVRWADYVLDEREDDSGKKKRKIKEWRRIPKSPHVVNLPLDAERLAKGVPIPNSDGICLVGKLEKVTAEVHALALFVVNLRSKGAKGRQDEQFIFQVSLELRFARGFLPRSNLQGQTSSDWDERVSDLQFREHFEYAVGHGVSVDVPARPPGGEPVQVVRTAWIPRAEVPRVVTHSEPDVVVSMRALAELEDGAALLPLVEAYGAWIESQRLVAVGPTDRAETKDALMQKAARAKDRIAAGIALLESNPEVLEAFRLTNRAMAVAAEKRMGRMGLVDPKWRLFQLAFLLLNLSGIADDTHDDREVVDLIFFPTGGGKTEAYLGVIAFTLLYRRLRGRARPDQGLGVAVLLRYTLRLLTLDQLGRAATLMCALEKIRQEKKELGEVRFSVGLWVGRSATANTIQQVAVRIKEYKNNPAERAASPFPLTHCPWCNSELTRNSLSLIPTAAKPEAVVVGCMKRDCDFAPANNKEGLPVLFVDEQIYRELPCFVVGTVDKFAMLPWRGETGMLFGRAVARKGKEFFGPLEKVKKGMEPLPSGLLPPELIVQDELHLISGPLGTMVGLYETAIEALCCREVGGKQVAPKVIASTATVRRATEQIRAIFGRRKTELFPPPGVDDSETWFAKKDRANPGRLYVGVAAQGRALKAILLRVYASLLGSANRLYEEGGPPDQPADGYMTVAGYFNSLRELGGMRRLVEDEVRNRCVKIEDRRPLGLDANPHYRNREIQDEPVELTSRESIARIKDAKACLLLPHSEKASVDVLLASNMISVGVDIDRLGLMVVAGQPKTTSEYIQASSRVGRHTNWPGLVVTCFNVHKPRDRSHYERFPSYHSCFYRYVEASSSTPFSGPALDRGLAGALVAITRLLDPVMTPPSAAMLIAANRAQGTKAVEALANRARRQPNADGKKQEEVAKSVEARGNNLLDAWDRLADKAREGAGTKVYSPYDKGKADNPLLHVAMEADLEAGGDEVKFVAPTSMRDVEPSVHLWIQRAALGGKGS